MVVPSNHPTGGLCLMLLCLLALWAAAATARGVQPAKPQDVTYDGRSLMIDGRRELLFSGSVHYPRSTPEMWPDIIAKAKHGGLNTIETYVFWNIHEPVQGQYNFSGRFDLVKFIKLVQANNMYVALRLGPFVQGEWNFGGLPCWLRDVPNIVFRTNNEPFKYHMGRFVTMIVQLMKDNKLFAKQGGPIILAQIENEYNNIAGAYEQEGVKYIKWAADLALSQNAGIPWVMCKQNDAPGPIINACNGRNCGDTFVGPNHPTKPYLWTENWTAQYRVFGDPPSQRAAEDIAYSVARFFSKRGTFVNYYMYHGGTNFGRTAAAFVMTRYYDEAPLDEFGLQKDPKWGHLKDLHAALKLCRKALLWGESSVVPLGKGLEARVFEKSDGNVCAAFLTNNNSRIDTSVTFRGVNYFLPRHSISILPDCKTVVFNTQRVNSQHNERTFQSAKESNKNNKWEMFREPIPKFGHTTIRGAEPMEHTNLTKDTTDYVWYTTSFNIEEEELPRRRDIMPVIQSSSLGHAMHAFVNGKYIGSGHGTKIDKSFVFQKPASLKEGKNHIALLGMTVGQPDSGAYLEHRVAGVHTVAIQGLNAGTLDLTINGWGHEVGLLGEKLGIFVPAGSKNVEWREAKPNQTISWYKTHFDAPRGSDPVALDMSSMGKGFVWINGESIGRYWVSYLSPLDKPSQSVYHIPRSFLKPKGNLMVVFEETGGNPEEIVVMTVRRDNICTMVSEFYPANVRSWARRDNQIRTVVEDVKPKAQLKCPNHKVIKTIVFASFGNPTGPCGNFTVGNCHAPVAKKIVKQACLGKPSCHLPVTADDYKADLGCPGTTSTLAVQVKCVREKAKGKKH